MRTPSVRHTNLPIEQLWLYAIYFLIIILLLLGFGEFHESIIRSSLRRPVFKWMRG